MARLLLDVLPPELATITTPEDRPAGYLDYRQFFLAWETPKRATECQALEVPQVSWDTRTAWIRDTVCMFLFLSYCYHWYSQQWLQGLVSTAHERTLKLLTTDWLVLEGGSSLVRPAPRLFFFVPRHSLGNTLQLTDACGNWHASARCSSRTHPPPAHAPRFLADTLTRVRCYHGPHPIRALIPADLVY